MPVAVITGASRGLGAALAHELDRRGWELVLDARDGAALSERSGDLDHAHLVPGDVTDPAHRETLAEAAAGLGGASLLVNNASSLGASPLPRVAEITDEVLLAVFRTNLLAPHALTRQLLPQLTAHGGRVLNISSDAAVEAYEGWGGYGSSKAALDQLTAVLAEEQPLLRVYAVDPGDMQTAMHQDAYPGEDISDRPQPETVAPRLLALVAGDLPSGRYRAADLPAAQESAQGADA